MSTIIAVRTWGLFIGWWRCVWCDYTNPELELRCQRCGLKMTQPKPVPLTRDPGFYRIVEVAIKLDGEVRKTLASPPIKSRARAEAMVDEWNEAFKSWPYYQVEGCFDA